MRRGEEKRRERKGKEKKNPEGRKGPGEGRNLPRRKRAELHGHGQCEQSLSPGGAATRWALGEGLRTQCSLDPTSSCPRGASGTWQWRSLAQEGLVEGNASGAAGRGLGPTTSHPLYVPTLFWEMKGLRMRARSSPIALLYGSRPEPGGKRMETQ